MVTSPLPDGARYCIVQSAIVRRSTFLLDRYMGEVRQMVKNKNGDTSWEKMEVLELGAVRVLGSYDKPRFQIYLGSIMAADSFLLDTQTGYVWQLFLDRKAKMNFWGPIALDS